MVGSIFTVVVPASTHDLTVLDTVKDELDITNSSQDARLNRWIAEASGFIESYCNRTFAEEQVSELWRSNGHMGRFHHHHHHHEGVGFLQLRRFPVTTIDSITEDDGTALTSDDYEIDAERGWLWRMSGQVSGVGGCRRLWCASKLVVTYTAGYALLDGLPYGIETACIEAIKHRSAARSRDPNLKMQEIPGELVQQWWVPGANEDGVPPEIKAMLDPHRILNV